MSRTILVTVSDDRAGRKGGLYGVTQKKIQRIFHNNRQFGLTPVYATWEDIINSNFYHDNKAMLDNPNPARNGRLYKPGVIRSIMRLAQPGDYIIYNDCSPEMWPMDELFYVDPETYSLDVIHALINLNDNFLTAFVRWDDKQIFPGEFGVHTHDKFTLDSCIEIMKGEHCRHSYQCASGMIGIRVTAETMALVENWYHYNRIKECSCMNVDETENSYNDGKPGQKLGNRHDQSVLSMLLNQANANYVDILHNDLNPYNFLNFCRRDAAYTLINSNTPTV